MSNLALIDSKTNRIASVKFPVAIVGYSYRMPGGIRTDDDFWQLLSEREIIREQITQRYGKGYRPIGNFAGPGRLASPYEGLIRDEEERLFDRSLFGISHTEMLAADPQVRMLLSCAWESIERSGWDLYALHNSATGVFIGAQVPAVASWRPMIAENEFFVTSTSLAMLANRVSYHFNLMGPSITYCTACSASLTAMHSALNSLYLGDCEQALVGSAHYLGSARISAAFNALGVISPEGKCHSFDADANGYLRSEGAFVYTIKPLVKAEQDGDHIHAVIEATAVNAAGTADGSDGLAQGRYITAPTTHSQVNLMRAANTQAGRSPAEIDYVEAHATGTVVGDRIEGNAISEAFGHGDRKVPLRISSVKSNVGHMEAAAFHCGLLKVLLMMQRRAFAPISKNFLVPNPEIDYDSCPMQVQTTCEPFPDRPVTVGINSFGFGGANGHCVVSEYRPNKARIWSVPPSQNSGFMIPLSARNRGALTQSAQQLLETVSQNKIDLYTLAGNLSCRRTHFAARTSFAVHNREDLVEALEAFAVDAAPVTVAEEGDKRVAMVFSGQGTQWSGCGRALYDTNAVFRRVIDTIDELWLQHAEVSLREVCFSASQNELDEVQFAQPAIFMIQCALLELFKTWGVYPDCVVGHSSGEVAAAYASGALSLAEATRLVFQRATLQQSKSGSGRMLAVALDRTGVEKLLDELGVSATTANNQANQVEIACVNAPANTVICGREDALQPVIAKFNEQNVQNVLLAGNIAFHSTAMDSLKKDVMRNLTFLDNLTFDLDVPFVSTVTGETTSQLDSAYWWGNIRQTVQFSKAMETVQREYHPDVVLEIAPHSALQPIIVQCLERNTQMPASVSTIMRDTDTRLGFLQSLGALFQAGVELDFTAQFPRPKPITHLLPGHPMETQVTMDVMCDNEMFVRQGQYSHGPLVGHRVPAEHPLFEARLSELDFPWLADHRIHRAPIMPAAGYIEAVLEAIETTPVYIEEVEFLKPCPIQKRAVRLQTALKPVADNPDEFTFTISSRYYDVGSENVVHCQGRVRRAAESVVPLVPTNLDDFDFAELDLVPWLSGADFYEHVEAILGDAFHYGPSFQLMQDVEVDVAARFCKFDIEINAELWASAQAEGFVFFPTLLDGGLQIFLYYLMTKSDLFAIPRGMDNLLFIQSPTSSRLTCISRGKESVFRIEERGQSGIPRGETGLGNVAFYDSVTGALVAQIGEYRCFNSNPNWKDIPLTKHVISWQPKFVRCAQTLIDQQPAGDIQPETLLALLENPKSGDRYTCHAIEITNGQEPEHTVLASCSDYLSDLNTQTEFWLICDDKEYTSRYYQAFYNYSAALRFVYLDPDQEPEFETGLLRPAAAEVLFIHSRPVSPDTKKWALLRQLAVPGGLALVLHENGEVVVPHIGWTVIRAGHRTTLLQATQSFADIPATTALLDHRWILGERASLATDWTARFDSVETVHRISEETSALDNLHTLKDWPEAERVRAIDFFCGDGQDDPTGEKVVARLVAFIQVLVSYRIDHASELCRLTVVTRNAAYQPKDPRGCGLWGAIRSIAAEVGEEAKLDLRLIDLGDSDDLETLAWLACRDLREREFAIRHRRLWVQRIISLRDRHSSLPEGEAAAYRLMLENPGQMDGLQMKTIEPLPLGPTDVEIEVKATALNFRDVMVTLGLLPMLAYERSAMGQEVGMEGSGIVTRIGTEVTHCQVADQVIFMQGGCIANQVTVDQTRVFVKPANLDMEQAASILSVYVTAYYSLIYLARIREGQRVLIHSAMGGVGQAAIALAKNVGAEIYATAGNADKRKQLQTLGVAAVFDSHSFEWYEDLMKATDGEGVDVVLNSLAGHHIELCLQALRPSGWHCEIGKVDIYANNDLSMRVLRKNLRFAAIDMDRLMLDEPLLSYQLSRSCLDLIDQGVVPPLPTTVFAYRDYVKALRLMAAGQHQGKLVLKAPETPSRPNFSIADSRPFLNPDATYLVTGGFGGFGLCVLPYLVAAGARHLTLMDRDPKMLRSIDWVKQSTTLRKMNIDVEIDIIPGDVSRQADVRRCVEQVKKPLKGVFHLAGTLDDRLLADTSVESVKRVFAPKAHGALHLHRATQDIALDHFVMFSSISSTFGNFGQINYSAANAYLDGLVAWRREQGLPGLSYSLAAIAESGMATRNVHLLRMMRAVGTPPVSQDTAIRNLDYALRSPAVQDHLMTILFTRPPLTLNSSDYMRTGRVLNNQNAFEIEREEKLTVETVVMRIAEKVAELCGHSEGTEDERLASFGLTSISVAELGTFIQTEFNHQVSALELMTTASCLSLAQAIVHGEKNNEDNQPETSERVESIGDTTQVLEQRARRVPSQFANTFQDHFPNHDDIESDIEAVRLL